MKTLARSFHGSLPGKTMLVGSAITASSGFVFWLIASRTNSVSDIGRASAIVSSAVVVIVATNLGLSAAFGKYANSSSTEDQSRFVASLCLTTSSSLVGGGFLLLLGPSRVQRAISSAPWLWGEIGFLFIVTLIPVAQIADLRLLALGRHSQVIIRSAIAATIKILVPLVLCMEQREIGSLFLFSLFLGPDAAIGLLSSAITVRLVPIRLSLRDFFHALREIFHVARINYITVLLTQGTLLTIPFAAIPFLDDRETANFYLGWSVFQSLFIIPQAVTSGLQIEGNKYPGRLSILIDQALFQVVSLSGVATILSVSFIKLFPAVFGIEFKSAGVVALLLTASSVFVSIFFITLAESRILLHHRVELLLSSFFAVFTMATVLLLAAVGGLIGAALGVFIGVMAACLIGIWLHFAVLSRLA